uniref:Uncharacterized protein n=1 Tax=Anguilla anguilla TaxID=7936 RepID=A0A0E9XT62_ANGAN
MDAILTCSKSAEELLKRRKVYREVIFKYLISEGIAMPPDADKNQLARRAMLFWALNSRVKSNKVRILYSFISNYIFCRVMQCDSLAVPQS